MKKNIFAIAILIVFLGSCYWLFFRFPNVIYFNLVNCQYRPFWFKTADCSKGFFPSKKIAELDEFKTNLNEEKYWKLIHLEDFKVWLPFRHPQIEVVPEITYDSFEKKTTLGFKIINRLQQPLFKLTFNAERQLKKNFDLQPLFSTPYVQNFIMKISDKKIWQDIFSLHIAKEKDEVMKLSFNEMIYQLYIWEIRKLYFSDKKIEEVTFIEKSNSAIISHGLKNDDKIETLYFLESGIIESFTMKTSSYYHQARELRERFIKKTFYFRSSPDVADDIYKDFLDLSFEEKLDQQGMLYLFSAWSHRQEDKKFIKDIIYYLERGQGNLQKLRFFYTYAKDRYGDEFMSNDSLKKIKLETEIEKEEKEKDEALKKKEVSAGDEVFKSHEERSQTMLERARRENQGKRNIQEDHKLKFD